MNFLKKNFGKIALGFFLVAFLVAPALGHAAATDPTKEAGCSLTGGNLFSATCLIGVPTYYLALWLGYLAAALVAVESYLVQLVLSINIHVIDSPIVKMGFPIALSLANLAFVAGIIIVAVATILHYESYGIKNILWKMLVMAVLINFGLIISSTILSFSDNITLYMVNQINPGGANNSFGSFADSLAGAFNPQHNTLSAELDKINDPSQIKNLTDAMSATGESIGKLLAPVLGLILSLFSYIIILIVLAALIVILLIRYIKLSFLLMSLPLSWAAWPFPAFHGKTSEWWEKFWKEAFVPVPIVFSLWLGLMFAQELNNVANKGIIAPGTSLPEAGSLSTGAGGAVAALLIGIFSPLANNFIRMILLGGIMVAGLAAANSMGASFAGTAMNAIKAGQNRAKNAVTSRIKNRAERLGIRAKEAIARPRAKLLQLKMDGQRKVESAAALAVKGDMTEYEKLGPIDKANAQFLMAQQKVGDVIQQKTEAPLRALGYEGHLRLGLNGIPRKRFRIKAGADGKPALALHVLKERDADLKIKKIYDGKGKELGEAVLDAAGNIPSRLDPATGQLFYQIFDRSGNQLEVAVTPDISEGPQITRKMKEVLLANAEGKAFTDANKQEVWTMKDASGNYQTDKNENGDLNIRDANGVIVGVARKTAVQIEGENGKVTKTQNVKGFLDKDGNLASKFADEDGHPLHGSSSIEGSYETQDKLDRLRKEINGDEHKREELIKEAREAPGIMGEAAAVVGETVGALGKGGGGGGASKSAPKSGGGGHH